MKKLKYLIYLILILIVSSCVINKVSSVIKDKNGLQPVTVNLANKIDLDGNLQWDGKEKIKINLTLKKDRIKIKSIGSADLEYIKAYMSGIGIATPIYANGSDADNLINVHQLN